MATHTHSAIPVEEDSASSIDARIDSLGLSTSSSTATESVTNESTVLKAECQKTPYLDGQYFVIDVENSSLRGSVTGICKLCDSEKKIKGTLRSSSNFISHLKRTHPSVYPDEYSNYVKAKKQKIDDKNAQQEGKNISLQYQYEENVINYILESMAPLSTVDMLSFRKMFDDLLLSKKGNVSIKHLTRRTLVRKIAKQHCQNMERLQYILKEVDYVCTTADIWTSSTRRFLGITVHWIDSNSFIRKSAAIACRRFSGTHSHDRIAKLIHEIHTSFGLSTNKIVATVTDNGTNFVKAFREFGIQLPLDLFDESTLDHFGNDNDNESDNESVCDEVTTDRQLLNNIAAVPVDLPDLQSNGILSVHYRCVSHTLNLIATTDVTNCIKSTRTLVAWHDEAITRCEVLWKQLRSPKKREILTQHLGKALMKPIPVRWNSLFYSLEQIFSLSEKISEVNRHLQIVKPLRDVDFQYIGEYLLCLRPIAETIDKLQGETHCLYGSLLPCLISLRRRLIRIRDSGNLVYCQPIADGLLNSIERRFNDFFKVQGNGCFAAIAAIVHPKFKTRWMGCLDETAQSQVYKAVMHAARIEDTIQPSTTSNQNIQDDFFDFGDERSNSVSPLTTFDNSDAEMQVRKYIHEPCSDNIFAINVYPIIKKLFMKYNTPLPSSAPVERLFSYATMHNLPRYNRLTDENFERRVLAASNIKKRW